MSTLTTAHMVGFAADSCDEACQTETAPKAGDYKYSRLNACTYQNRRDDVLVCLGDRCPYRFCDHAGVDLPDFGSECPWELMLKGRLENEFCRRYPLDGIGRHLDDYDGTKREFMIATLLANRASIRASIAVKACCDAVTDRGQTPVDHKPFEEHALALRYRTTARNRLDAVMASIASKIREARIRTAMIENGLWRPYEDPEPPSVNDAPCWILEIVDGRRACQ